MKFLSFDNRRDFPYYNHNPKLSKSAWFVLLLSILFSILLYGIIGYYSEFIGSIVFCSVMLIPLLYFSNWDYSLIFKKLIRDEIILAVLMFAGYIVYVLVVGFIFDSLMISQSSSPAFDVNVEVIISLIFSMMGEELLKFIPFVFIMRVVFKFTGNRKWAIIVSSILVLIGFGLMHFDPHSPDLASVLIFQGFGSIFEVYGYLKTKNILVPYLSHILTDAFIFTMLLMGFT